MARRLVVLLTLVVLLSVGLAAVRAAAWTPIAPASLGAVAWEPVVHPDGTSWQTLDHVTFEAAGATFVAELQGFPRITSGAIHSMVVRIVRIDGEDARIQVGRGVLDGVQLDRVDTGRDALEARFTFHRPSPGPYAFGAELDVRAWREVAWGYREVEPLHVVLRADVERIDPGTGEA